LRAGALVLGLTGALVLPALSSAQAQPSPDAVTVGVDASRPIGAVNPNLVGFAFDRRINQPQFTPLGSRTFRLDAGLQDMVKDCTTLALDPTALTALQSSIDEIQAAGAEPIVILTYLPPCLADTYPPFDPRDPTKAPPKSAAAWHAVITELVDALGPGRQQPVHYYEVWNEPDWFFFEGTQQQFIDRVMTPAGHAVNEVAQASGLDLRFGICGCLFADPSWMIPLMNAAQQAHIQVGFVSWHYYGNYPFIGPDGVEPSFPSALAPVVALDGQRNPLAGPEQFLIQLDQVRAWAAAALGTVPELMIDEWNLSAGGFDKRMDTNEGAAFQAATLAALASDHLDRAALFSAVDPYDRDVNGNPLPARYGGWGVVDRSLARKPAWYAQWLWQRLQGQRLDSPQDPAGGVWTAAARDGSRVDVLVASFQATGAHDRDLQLHVAGLAPGQSVNVELFRIDGTNAGSTAPTEAKTVTTNQDGTLDMATALPAQSVVLVELG